MPSPAYRNICRVPPYAPAASRLALSPRLSGFAGWLRNFVIRQNFTHLFLNYFAKFIPYFQNNCSRNSFIKIYFVYFNFFVDYIEQ